MTVTIGGRELTPGPLNFKALRAFAPTLTKLSSTGIGLTDLDTVRDVILASLQRNHPDITAEFLDENLDLLNSPKVIEAILLAGGAQQASGEQKPNGATGPTPIGTNSTST